MHTNNFPAAKNCAASIVVVLCLGLPFFWTWNVNVIPSFYNEVIAYVVWGMGISILLYFAPLSKIDFPKVARLTAPALAIFTLQLSVLTIQYVSGKSTPYLGMVCVALFALMSAAMCALAGAQAQLHAASNSSVTKLLRWCIYAVVFIGFVQALFGWLQYFGLHTNLPFISKLTTAGRAYGNLRQANIYALLLVLSLACSLWLAESKLLSSGRLRITLLLAAGMSIAAIALSASRIGFVLLCCIGVWGIFEFKASRQRGIIFLSVPLLYAGFRWLFTLLSDYGVLTYHGGARVMTFTQEANMDRISIWKSAAQLISDFPFLGVGYKRFSQQVFENEHAFRLSVNTENVHNLLLQWSLDFGVPIALALTALVVFCFYKCLVLLKNYSGRVILFCLAAPLLHQLVEYPLDYVYFLFPWAFLMGIALTLAASFSAVKRSEVDTPLLGARSDMGVSPNQAIKPAIQVSGWTVIPLLMIVAPLFAAYDIKKILPLFDVKTYAIAHERLTKAYGTVLYTYFADYSALRILPPAPELAAVQLSLAKKVSYFMFDDVVASVYARSAALSGQGCLAKATAYRIWLADKKAFLAFKTEVEQSTYPQMDFLKSFVQAPVAVAWPKSNVTTCE